MSNRFVAIDLAGLSPPDVVERLDYESILTELKADAVARLAEVGITYNVGSLETDPVVVVLQTAAYRETLLRARVNDATKAIMVAYAVEADLEHRGAALGVKRMVTPATETTPEVRESNDAYRKRIQLAPEAFAAAGPEGAYAFHALTVDLSIKDVAVLTPEKGQIHVLPLVSAGNGTPSNDLIERVRRRLMDKKIKPATDILTVRAPIVVPYTVTAQLVVGSGPDRTLILASARSKLAALISERHRIGAPVNRSALFAALHVAGVERVAISAPASDVVPADDAVAFATSTNVTLAS